MPAGRPAGKNSAIKDASERFWASGRVGMVVLMKVPAENILLHRGPREALTVQEEFIGVQNVIAKIFVGISVKFSGAGLEDGVDVAAAVSSLAGVVKRSLNLKLLDDVGVGQRHVRGLRHVVIRRADPFDQAIVVV